MNQSIPTFGEILPGVTYVPRPGTYAILLNEQGKVCLVKAPSGYTLPGGGKDPGETDEVTLHREVLEETGYSIEIIKHLGYGNTPTKEIETGKYFLKEGSYFLCRILTQEIETSEEDHIVEWLDYNEAISKIASKKNAHAWILNTYFS